VESIYALANNAFILSINESFNESFTHSFILNNVSCSNTVNLQAKIQTANCICITNTKFSLS